jgi:hypothetical protein
VTQANILTLTGTSSMGLPPGGLQDLLARCPEVLENGTSKESSDMTGLSLLVVSSTHLPTLGPQRTSYPDSRPSCPPGVRDLCCRTISVVASFPCLPGTWYFTLSPTSPKTPMAYSSG